MTAEPLVTTTEEQKASLMREFTQTLGKPDLDKSLTYLTDDATWETPEGVFRGRAELKRYLNWLVTTVPDLKVTESGVGIVVQGNRAAFQHQMQGTVEGNPCSWPALCTYEFVGDKIQKMSTVQDRLSLLNQAAKGWLEETIIHALTKRAEKGL
jgi:hypothetical protein